MDFIFVIGKTKSQISLSEEAPLSA